MKRLVPVPSNTYHLIYNKMSPVYSTVPHAYCTLAQLLPRSFPLCIRSWHRFGDKFLWIVYLELAQPPTGLQCLNRCRKTRQPASRQRRSFLESTMRLQEMFSSSHVRLSDSVHFILICYFQIFLSRTLSQSRRYETLAGVAYVVGDTTPPSHAHDYNTNWVAQRTWLDTLTICRRTPIRATPQFGHLLNFYLGYSNHHKMFKLNPRNKNKTEIKLLLTILSIKKLIYF